jgi:hypothetical protein
MNISGYQDNNFHDGSTQILGDLIVDGKLTLGGATGQSEYLDSGDYTGTILGVPITLGVDGIKNRYTIQIRKKWKHYTGTFIFTRGDKSKYTIPADKYQSS